MTAALAKFLLRDPGFLSAGAREISQKRIDAIRAVRKLLQRPAGFRKPDAVGGTMSVYGVGDNVVKTTPSIGARDFIDDFLGAPPRKPGGRETRRRAYLKDLLHAEGLAPETHLVQTRRANYLVQPKLSPDYVPPAEIESLISRMNSARLTPTDIRASNVRKNAKGEPQVIDAGLVEYPDVYPYSWGHAWGNVPVQTEVERRRAREKIVSYGKRAKPWLSE